MGLNAERREIGGHIYEVHQLGAIKARALFVRLTKALGPVLSSLLESTTMSTRKAAALQSFAMAPVIEELALRITEEDFCYLCDVLGECTFLVGDKGQLAKLERKLQDVHFAGRMLDSLKWLGFAIEVNFADFFSLAKSKWVAASAPLENNTSRSPMASTGSSGESSSPSA